MSTMIEVVKKRLESLGYEVVDHDNWALSFIIEKTSDHIENSCNISTIPDNLFFFTADFICTEFLRGKKAIGQLEGFDVEAAVKQIKAGDTSITYAIADSMDSLESLHQSMNMSLQQQLVKYRRLAW